MRHLEPDVSADPSDSEAFASEIEKRDLMQRIHHPQTVIELQAIDDPYGVAQPNMLRAQVAVSINKMPLAHSCGENATSLREGGAGFDT